MLRRNVRQGFVALVFAAGLIVGGAQPAAAEGLSWREAWDWVSNLWQSSIFQPKSAIDGVQGEGIPPATLNGDCGPEIDPDGCHRTHATGGESPSGV